MLCYEYYTIFTHKRDVIVVSDHKTRLKNSKYCPYKSLSPLHPTETHSIIGSDVPNQRLLN